VNVFWADKPVQKIGKGDVLVLLDDIAAQRQRIRAHAGDKPLAEARAVMMCLSTLFRWATAEDKIISNPMLGIRRDRFGKIVARDRVL
jgi:hypothetical protein